MKNTLCKSPRFSEHSYSKSALRLICSELINSLLQQFNTYWSTPDVLNDSDKTPENLEHKYLWKQLSNDILTFPASHNSRHLSSHYKTAVHELRYQTEVLNYKSLIQFTLTHDILKSSLNLSLNLYIMDKNSGLSVSETIIEKEVLTFKDFYPYTLSSLKSFWKDCINIDSKIMAIIQERIPSFKNVQIAAASLEAMIIKLLDNVPYSFTYSDLYIDVYFDTETPTPLRLYYSDFLKNPSKLPGICCHQTL